MDLQHTIPWSPEKIAAQISYQVRLPKTAQICAACTANWLKLPKNELQKNIWYNHVIHSVPKIVALITVRANMGVRTYMGRNSWHMR